MRRLRLPDKPPPGPTDPGFWKSPIRGSLLTSLLGLALLCTLPIVALTGFLSHAAYDPQLGRNNLVPGAPDLLPGDWPTSPSWLFAFTQGLHVSGGIVLVPLLLAKLWSVIPRLFEWPPVRSPLHALERLSLLALVGGAAFQFATGILNSQLYYPWKFNFVVAHYWGAWVFVGALTAHVVIKLPTVRRSLAVRREIGLGAKPEPHVPGGLAPPTPAEPTITRRGVFALAGAGAGALFLAVAGQSIGGPLRSLAVLAPRNGRLFGDGPELVRGQQDGGRSADHAGHGRPGMAAPARRSGDVARGTAGDGADHRLAADRLRRGLVDDAVVDRRAAARVGAAGRRAAGSEPARRVAAAARRVPPDDAVGGRGGRRALAAGAARQRRRPVARSRLSGADHRSGAAGRAQHEMGGGAAMAVSDDPRPRPAAAHGPLALLVTLGAFGLIGWALSHSLDPFDSRAIDILVWMVAGALLHDLVLLPAYSLLDRGLRRLLGAGAINYFRFPAFVSGVLFLAALPLILQPDRVAGNYRRATGVDPDGYLQAWLLITLALFVASGAALALRAGRSARRAGRQRSGPPPSPR